MYMPTDEDLLRWDEKTENAPPAAEPDRIRLPQDVQQRAVGILASEQGLKQQGSVISVSDQSAKRIMNGPVYSCLWMPTSGWILWVFTTEMNQRRQ